MLRARIAVCEVVPPRSITKPSALLSASMSAGRDVRGHDDRRLARGHQLPGRARKDLEHALGHLLHVRPRSRRYGSSNSSNCGASCVGLRGERPLGIPAVLARSGRARPRRASGRRGSSRARRAAHAPRPARRAGRCADSERSSTLTAAIAASSRSTSASSRRGRHVVARHVERRDSSTRARPMTMPPPIPVPWMLNMQTLQPRARSVSSPNPRRSVPRAPRPRPARRGRRPRSPGCCPWRPRASSRP